MNSGRGKDIYVYNMPLKERHDLCQLLDENNAWTILAQHMNFSESVIEVCNSNGMWSMTHTLVEFPK